MKHVLPYRLFEASATAPAALTEEQVKWLDKCTSGTWKLNPQTGLVDVDGNFNCREQRLRDLKGVRFGVVEGNFDCYNNGLTSLEGVPREVKGNFYCHRNQLTSLEGAPQEVKGNFYCQDNQLTTLEGAPQVVGGNFSCEANELTSLVGAPRVVGGGFFCSRNQLTSLVGAPRVVKGDFACKNNELTSLKGAPRVVKGYFRCGYNRLTSLVGAPQVVEGGLWDFDCEGNPVPETTLKSIFSLMRRGKSYQEALESLWSEIPQDDKSLLWRPEFKWVDEKESKILKAIRTVNNLKGMI
jgi:hypothetical protein